jgi:hypothetical protein
MSTITSIKQLIDKGYVFCPLEGSGEKNKSLATFIEGNKNNHKRIALKVFFNNTKAGRSYDNSLPLEKNIYKYLLSPLIAQQHTPNILKYFGSFSEPFVHFRGTLTQCATELDELLQRAKGKEERDRKHHDILIRDTNNLTVLGLEYSAAPTLRQWLQTERSDNELKSVLFQIIYTAECLYRIGIRHNDLHVGNILISSSKQKEINYRINISQIITVPTTNTLVKIYDFDNACGIRSKNEYLSNKIVKSVYYNYKLKYYKYWDQYGMSDSDNSKYDTFTILSSITEILNKYKANRSLLNLIEEYYLKSEDLRSCHWKYVHRMGKKKDGSYFHESQNSSQPDYFPKDNELADNNSILNDKIFDEWKIQPNSLKTLNLDKQSSVYTIPNSHI